MPGAFGATPFGGDEDLLVAAGSATLPDCQNSDKLLQELLLRMGNRQDIQERAKVWLDQAYRVVIKKYKFRELEVVSDEFVATVAGQREYAFPSKAYLIRSIRDLTNKRFLQDKDWTDLERITESVGKPNRWARHGYIITLDPTPEGVYNLRARIKAKPPALEYPGNNTEQLFLPCEWSEAVLRLAKAIAHGSLPGEELESDQAMTLYGQFLSGAIEIEVEEDRDLEQTLRPRTET